MFTVYNFILSRKSKMTEGADPLNFPGVELEHKQNYMVH